jgi:hypothetical protein
MLSNVSSSVFTGSDSITLTPVVSAEWNHNLFNAPYITTAGVGTPLLVTLASGGSDVSNVTSGAKPNFETKTKSFAMFPPDPSPPTPITTSTPNTTTFAITGSVVDVTTINISWSNPPAGTVFYRVQTTGQSDTISTGTNYTFSGLSSNTEYTLSVDAYNASFGVLGSVSVSLTTLGAPPDMVSTGKVSYTISGGSSSAYKVITYVKTSSPIPVMINASGKGTDLEYGSEQVEADSLGWTKIITYVGSQSPDDTFAGFVYTITANSISGERNNPIVYFTVP